MFLKMKFQMLYKGLGGGINEVLKKRHILFELPNIVSLGKRKWEKMTYVLAFNKCLLLELYPNASAIHTQGQHLK
jgi:hypothetical protein